MPYLGTRGGSGRCRENCAENTAGDGNTEKGDQSPRLPGGATPEPHLSQMKRGRMKHEGGDLARSETWGLI